MEILILSQSPSLYSTRRLAAAGRKLGHHVRVRDPMSLFGSVGDGEKVRDADSGRPVTADLVIPRFSCNLPGYAVGVVGWFESRGCAVLNGSVAFSLARNKLRSLQVLSAHGLPVPATWLITHPEHIASTVKKLGGYPVIAKTLKGTQGQGVLKAENERELRSILDLAWMCEEDMLVQEYIEESQGRDIRAFVVGGKVVAAMQRSSNPGDFRANIHQGGTAEKIRLSRAQETLALRSARALGLHVAGVDMLASRRGPLTLEANPSPGLEGIESVSGARIAEAVIRHGVALARRRPTAARKQTLRANLK